MTRYRDYGTEREPVDEPTGEFQSYPGHPEGPWTWRDRLRSAALLLILATSAGLVIGVTIAAAAWLGT